MSDFDRAFEIIIGNEGGYQNNPLDRGNWTGGQIDKGELRGTKYGISAAAYPRLNIQSLSVNDAKLIYKRDYWDAAKCEQYPYHVSLQVFDAAVNHGVSRAILMLQEALDVKVDGVVGPITIGSAIKCEAGWFKARFNGVRLSFYTDLSEVQWATFGKGWARRVSKNLMEH